MLIHLDEVSAPNLIAWRYQIVRRVKVHSVVQGPVFHASGVIIILHH